MNLFLLDIIEDTVVDGPGFRTSLYAAGCRHHCPGCHNPQSWEREHGHAVGVEEVAERLLTDPFSNITFSGGDPLEQVEAFTELAKLIKKKAKRIFGVIPVIATKRCAGLPGWHKSCLISMFW